MRSSRALDALTNALTISVVAFALGGCSGASSSEEDVTSEESEDLSTNSNEHTAFKYFVDKGLTRAQAAGIVGNLMQESSVSPTIAQPGGPGRGIAQWSVGGRWDRSHADNVEWFAREKHRSMHSLELQLEFIWYELEHFSSYGLHRLRHANDVREATIVFQNDYEGCGTCDQSRRIAYAKSALRSF